MRNLTQYQRDYTSQPFDDTHLHFRRRALVAQIVQGPHERVLEISCGKRALFEDFDGFGHLTVLEPTEAFIDKARAAAAQRPELNGRVDFVHATLENGAPLLGAQPFDFIVLSNVLQEIADPEPFLAALRGLCGPETRIHVVVPNARSFHRLWAYEAGLVESVDALSDRNLLLQQARVFDRDTLEATLSDAGFAVESTGTCFIKPFTHQQMHDLMEAGILSNELLDGLDRMTAYMPDLGAELYMNCRLA